MPSATPASRRAPRATAYRAHWTSTDALTYAVVLALVLPAVLLAALRPALRASRVDPLVALRDE